jgi:asparaginyl-tRNA synthetase
VIARKTTGNRPRRTPNKVEGAMQRTKIVSLLQTDHPHDAVLIKGWVRTRRDARDFSFIEVNDGSCLANIQVIADATLPAYDQVKRLTVGTAVAVEGQLAASQGKGQQWEIVARDVNIIGMAADTYPLQKKRHTDEFLRTIAHLRPRTNKYGALFRIRSEMSYAVHHFFKTKQFRYIQTPIITGSDCEGAGELFRVTTLDLENVPLRKGQPDYTQDFFGTDASLTVSGQLSAEMFALALGDVYTFGPTFRAENSNTRRHAAEFWMIEPEMAFCDLEQNMQLGQELIQYLTRYVLRECPADLALFGRFVDKHLLSNLNTIATSTFVRLPYTEAVDILRKSKQTFTYPVEWGKDLQTEHERFLTETHFKQPVIVFDYPKQIKPFYMRVNDDGQTVAAMDVLVPGVGEIIGGSQREERLDVLIKRIEELGLSKEDYWWYIDSRRYGSVPHSGFGLGFERLVMMATGVTNIRDVIPFPRTPNGIDF